MLQDIMLCLYTLQNFHLVAARGLLFLGNWELSAGKNIWARNVIQTEKSNVVLFTNTTNPRKPRAQYRMLDSPTATPVLNEVNLYLILTYILRRFIIVM
jgi:hypothetical protein